MMPTEARRLANRPRFRRFHAEALKTQSNNDGNPRVSSKPLQQTALTSPTGHARLELSRPNLCLRSQPPRAATHRWISSLGSHHDC
jgi:hypothetical protein